MVTEEKKFDLITECVAIRDKYIYCVAREMNIILKINMESLQVETMIDMPDEDGMVERLYLGIYIDGDDMMLVPCNARKLWIYNFVSSVWKSISIARFVNPNMNAKFVGGALKNGKAYLYGFRYKGILVADIDSGEVFELLDKEGQYTFWGESAVEIDNKLYVANRLESNVICINTDNLSWSKLPICGCEHSDKYKNDGIVYISGQFYIMPHHGNYFIKWNIEEASCRVETDDVFDSMKNFFNGIAASKNNIYIYGPGGKSYIYNINTPNSSRVINETVYFVKYYEKIGFIVCKKGVIDIFDSNLNLLKEIPLQINDVIHRKYIEKCKMSHSVLRENNVIGLDDLIVVLKNSSGEEK